MTHLFLEETAIGDIAFVAEGKTREELFTAAGLAVVNTMARNWEEIGQTKSVKFEVEAPDIEMLLFHFLQELIYYKDAHMLLFNKFDMNFAEKGDKIGLRVIAYGEELNPSRHELTADVKAVALHNFRVEQKADGWRAEVILDV